MSENSTHSLTIGEAVPIYQHHIYKEKDAKQEVTERDKSFLLHDLGHMIAEALTHKNHILDFKYAKENLPLNRIAGYEAEPIAVVYEWFIEGYSPDNSMFDNQLEMVDEILQFSAETDNSIINDDIEKLQRGEKIAPNRSVSHNEARERYARNPDSIIYPSEEEMLFHFAKAKEMCERIKEHIGEYPSEIYQKDNGDFEKLPINLFETDNIYKEAEQSKPLDDSHVQRFKQSQQAEASKDNLR